MRPETVGLVSGVVMNVRVKKSLREAGLFFM